MPLSIDKAGADASSRLSAIRLAALTLRCMENWRQPVDDYDSAMIMVAIIAICGDRLTRGEPLAARFRSLREPLPKSIMGACNISSIAAATGLNRETTRRKVRELSEAGMIVRSEDGTVAFAPGLLQQPEMIEMVRRQLEAVTRTMNALIRDGSIRVSSVPAYKP